MSTKLLRSAVAAVALAIPTLAHAQFTTFSSQAAFDAATSARATDTFNDLYVGQYGATMARTVGAYTYTVAVPGSIYTAGNAGDTWMSTNTATDPIVFGNFGTPVFAIGGFFFGSDVGGQFRPGQTVTVTATNALGSTSMTLPATTTSTFLGFLSSTPIDQLTVTAGQLVAGAYTWPTVNDLTLGQAAPTTATPEPATVALFSTGLLALGVAARRRRTR